MGLHSAQELDSPPAFQDAAALRQVFEAITPESCPRLYNFHMHTICSDGRLTPEGLIQQAISLGLQGLAITDHHSLQGFRRAQAWLTEQQPAEAPHLWSGVEINAQLLHEEVHILGYAVDPDHEALQPYVQGHGVRGDRAQAHCVIAAIHAAGGIAVLAHPARYRHSPAELIEAVNTAGIDGVESYYAYNNPNPWHPSPKQTREVFTLGEYHGLLHTCGTDTHGMNLLQRL